MKKPIPFFKKLKILFVNGTSFFGLIFLIVGISCSLAFLDTRMFDSVYFLGKTSETTGQIVYISDTNIEINDEDLYKVEYKYYVGKTLYSDKNYGTWLDVGEGDRVTVEYVKSKPQLSKVEDLSRSKSGLSGLFILIFPLIGIVAFAIGFKQGTMKIYLLENGQKTEGRVLDVRATNTSINDRRVFKVYITYQDSHGTSHELKESSVYGYEWREGDIVEVLYSKSNPKLAASEITLYH